MTEAEVMMVQYDEEAIERWNTELAFFGYAELQECRRKVDDCLAGQKTIKSKEKYLPANDWQKKHRDQYEAFLRRALFPGETKYALDIYQGLFSLGEPKVILPADGSLDFIIGRASVYGDNLKAVQMRVNSEQMAHGLRCLLLDVRESEDEPFVIKEYSARKFLRSHFTTRDGESIADFILLDESTSEYDLTTFQDKVVYYLRILALDANGEYYQRQILRPELNSFDVLNPPQDERTIYPALSGVRFNKIPFVWAGANTISGASFDYPPLLSMADTELALYVAMANHSQHIYMNTQEILVFSGVNKEAIPDNTVLGCGAFLTLANADAKAQYISTNGVGFDAEDKEITQLKNAIEQKRLSLMSAKSHQSGTVVGMVQNSQSAPLRTIVNNSGAAITQILRYMAEWMGKDDSEVRQIRYIPSQQFADPKVNMSEFIALCKAVKDGEVLLLEEQLYDMARESGFVADGMTWEQFKQKYDIEKEERLRDNSILPQTTGNPFAQNNGEASA